LQEGFGDLDAGEAGRSLGQQVDAVVDERRPSISAPSAGVLREVLCLSQTPVTMASKVCPTRARFFSAAIDCCGIERRAALGGLPRQQILHRLAGSLRAVEDAEVIELRRRRSRGARRNPSPSRRDGPR
jgi:hypothetical protein